MSSRRYLQIGAAILVMAAIGYLVAKQLTLADVARLAEKADVRLLALGLAAYLMANVLRARRFRALTGDQLPTMQLLRTVFVQNFLNTFLPLRAGELSYLVMVHRTGAVKPGENLASLVGARVLDLVAALLIPLVTLPMSAAWSGERSHFVWFVAAAVVAGGALALGIWRAEALAGWLIQKAAARSGWLARGLQTGGDTLRALAQLRRASLLGRVAALTAGCWGFIYLSGYVSLLGVGVPIGLGDGLFAYSFPTIASMTPFYMLGGFGVYEGSIGIGLNVVGIPLSTAMSAGLLLHVAELVYVIVPAPFGLSARSVRK